MGVPKRNIADYSSFGVSLDGRTIERGFYRRGFNGMELDDEVKGGGNSYDFGARMYNPKVGTFLSTDNYKAKYPDISPYVSFINNPNSFVDKSGDTVTITVFGNSVGTTMINLYSASEIKANPKLKGKQIEVPVYEVTVTNENGSTATYFYTRISYRGSASDPTTATKDVTYNVNKETNVQGVIKSRWGGKDNVLELRDFKNKSNQTVRGTRGMGSKEETDRVAIQFHVKGASDGCLLAVGEDQFVLLSYELFIDDKLKKANVGSNSSTAQSNFMNSVMSFQQQDLKKGKSDFIKIVIQPIEKPAEKAPK